MNAQSPSPAAQNVASRPCRLCGGAEFSWFPSVTFVQVEGSSANYFELVVCRTCRRTDMFVQLDQLERLNPHGVMRAAPTSPQR
jgi:hypothetical protein